MKNIQKVGAFASLAFGISFIALLGLLLTIASQGYIPGSGNNPAKALEFAGSSPIPYIIYLLYALFAILITLIVLAMADLLKADAPIQMHLATVAASATGVLFLAYAMLGYVGEPTLIAIYRRDAVLGASVYIATRVVSNALNTGAIFASGWAILLVGLAALGAGKLPKLLACLLVLAGILAALAFVIPMLALIAPLLYFNMEHLVGCYPVSKASHTISARQIIVRYKIYERTLKGFTDPTFESPAPATQ